jgi:hypothetical protein
MKKKTQEQKIISYVERFGSITPLEAISDLSVYRLASRMSSLKGKGYTFKTETVHAVNRYGEPTHFARYSEIKAPAV